MSAESPNLIPTLDPVFAARKRQREKSAYPAVWQLLDQVFDPELPGLTIWDLGILQDVRRSEKGWEIDVTPTYSGCPAVETINQDINTAMTDAGFVPVSIKVVLSPAWSTEMISPQGNLQLKSMHIAPPSESDQVSCPLCGSANTQVISQFGSTACKALYQCLDCHEAFDYFKHF